MKITVDVAKTLLNGDVELVDGPSFDDFYEFSLWLKGTDYIMQSVFPPEDGDDEYLVIVHGESLFDIGKIADYRRKFLSR